MKALLIEDDRLIGDILADALTSHHWVVEQAWDGEAGLALTNVQEYDLILLDIGLPKLDGITVCKRLRSQGCQTPILLMTGQNSAEAQITGLDAGADDYVTKPFDLDILLARVRSVARKSKSATPILTWENIHVDSTNGEVRCNGNTVHLRAKELGLLELFLLNPKRIFSRRAILDHLWDVAHSSGEETVSTHVKCVRQKLKAAGASDPIETVHGLGYRLRSPQVDPAPPIQPAKSLSSSPVGEGLRVGAEQKAQAVTSKVWNQFKTQYAEQIQTLETLLHTLQPGEASSQQQECKDLAHKLVGSMGMFGLLEASQHARDLEQLMKASFLKAEQVEAAIQDVEFLKQAIAQAQVTLPQKPQPLPPQNTALTTAAPILIVDDDLLLADRLRIEAIAWHLQVEIATDLTVARQMIAQNPPSIILLDLTFPGEENGLTLMQELAQRSPHIPIVVFTAKEDFCDRIAAARLGVSAFLQKPLPAHEILKTITDVLKQKSHPSRQDRLLIVDDDPGFLAALSERLSGYGLQVTTTAEPQNFWNVLASCTPNVLVLDLEMPEFNGLELCQVVRADPKWQHLKILFLSAHTESDVITRAYAAGADDYISKTIPAEDLVTRILQRVGHN
ncbi:response regulator [Oscillatoria sp. FACHB-1407]|uniref:response regulator n=1 Tax=Oscillatoria sp. FACHB-1407 TaxID=2692847 RepID=UPI00168A0B76|nr:response regulator [Oscillatoria sp. FACHB-1407]MBD2463463.1 response regulator [Oscillatoria sp. FACHB-1407]